MRWKRIIGWIFACLLALLIGAATAIYFYLRSTNFRHYALAKIVAEADAATGGKAEIGALDFQLSTLTAHLYEITLRGGEDPARPPLFHADKLTLRVKILSTLHRQFALRELLVDHPVVFVEVSRDGRSNLPTARPSQSGSHTSVFDLAVEHAQLTKGEINYNDRKAPLDANLYGLATNIHFEPFAKRYSGELSYTNGSFHYAQYSPIPHKLALKFSATPQEFSVSSAVFKIASSEMVVNARCTNYDNPAIEGDYQIRIHTQDFAAMTSSVAPAGDVLLNGKLHYRNVQVQSPIRSVSLEGRVASDLLAATASGRHIQLRQLEGKYQLAGGNLQVSDIKLESMGGEITGTARVENLDTTPDTTVRAMLRGISLRAIQSTAGEQPLTAAAVSGTVQGSVDADWKGDIANLRAQTDMFVQATASSRSNPSGAEVPINGAIHASYDSSRQTVEVRDTVLRIPSAMLTAQGTVSDHSRLQMKVAASDLHQLASLVFSFYPMNSVPPSVSGSATLNAQVGGSLKKARIAAQLDAENLQIEGSGWKSAKLALRANPSEIVIDNASLVNANKGQASLKGSVGLAKWSYQPANPILAQLTVQQMSLAELQRLARREYPVSGIVSAHISVSGSQLQPTGSGSAQITNAKVYGEPVQNLSAKFHAANASIDSTLNAAAPAGVIDASLSYTPQAGAYKIRIDAPAIVLEKFQTLQQKNLPVNGTLSLSVNGQGTLDDPQMVVALRCTQLQVRQNTISGLNAQVQIARHTANSTLDATVSQVPIHGRLSAKLVGDYDADATIHTGPVPLDALLAAYTPSVPQGFQGQTELHASLKGPLKDTSRIEAHLSIPVLKASFQSLQVGIVKPVRLDYANSLLTLQPAELEGTGTSLRAEGLIPLGGKQPPTFTAQGTLDVRILKIIAPTVQSSGTVALDVRSSGPAIQGQLRLSDVALSTADAPMGVSKLNGTINIMNDRAQVSTMTAEVGGGQISLGGSVTYRPRLQFNLALQGKGVRLRYPEGLRSSLDANLAYSGTTQASTLNGRVVVDSLSFTPDFDLSKFADQFGSGNALSQPGFADTLKLAISVQAQNLNATSSQVSIAGQAALEVRGTASNPVLTGRTTLASGELFYRNIRYQLQRGVITFDDPNEMHPVLNVSVTTLIEQYNLTLTLRGPLDKLTTSYVSDPPLATADIINLVARGKTIEEQAASSQSTDSMIASQVASQLTTGVQKLAGISSLEIDPTLGGNNQNPGARVAIQQRVTKDLLFSFSTDVSQPGSEIVQGEYQINKRWSVSVERDQVGGVSVDGRYHTKF